MVTHQKNIYIILALSGIALLATLGVCYSNLRPICEPSINQDIALSIILFAPPLFLSSLILLFADEKVFRSWARFTKIFLPTAVILIILSPSQPSFLNPDRELTTWWMAGLFLATSILLIAWKWWKTRPSRISA